MADNILDGEIAMKISELVGSTFYASIQENRIQPEHFSLLTHEEWQNLGIPIGTRYRLLELVGSSSREVQHRRRASLLSGGVTLLVPLH